MILLNLLFYNLSVSDLLIRKLPNTIKYSGYNNNLIKVFSNTFLSPTPQSPHS